MTERKCLNTLLNLDEVKQLELGDFLKQEPEVDETGENEGEGGYGGTSSPQEEGEEGGHEGSEAPPNQKKGGHGGSSAPPCQNPTCQDPLHAPSYHIFEISGDNRVVICQPCYQLGYRFCLFTLDVLPMDQMDPVLDNMYAQPEYHQNQLTPERLYNVTDLYMYFKMIGLENPNPRHILIKLNKVQTLQ